MDISNLSLSDLNPLDMLMGKKKHKVASKFAFYFGLLVGGCAKVKNIKRKTDREAYQEGGLNEKPIILASPQAKLEQLVLEKAFVRMNPMLALYSAEPFLKSHIIAPGALMVLNNYKIPIRLFVFEKGIISEWSVTDLDAKSPEIMIDSVTIEHSGLIEMPVSL